jgi:hypothetical protein
MLLAANAAAAAAEVPSNRRLKNSHDQPPLRTRLSARAAMYRRRSVACPRRVISSSAFDDTIAMSA